MVGPYSVTGAPPLPMNWRGAMHVVGGLGRSNTPTGLTVETMASIVDGTSNTTMVGEYSTTDTAGAGPRRKSFWAYGYTSYNQSAAQPYSITLLNNYAQCIAGWNTQVPVANGVHVCKRALTSMHPGGMNALKADGSVFFAKHSMNRRGVWMPLATIQGGEIISSDSY